MPLFSRLPPVQPDEIFALAKMAKAAGAEGIDATVGMIADDDGKPLLLPSVVRAFEDWTRTPRPSFAYPPLLGLPEYRDAVTRLLTGTDDPWVASIATTGGTGAVAVALRILALLGIQRIVLPVPSWPNHRRMIAAAGLQVATVPFLAHGRVNIDALLSALQSGPAALLLQGDCHNPTGKSLTPAEWRELAQVVHDAGGVILLDFAYQGLGGEPEDDALPIRILRSEDTSLLVAWSASKNHTLYGLRTGLACAFAKDPAERETIEGHFAILTRTFHSAAPSVGQAIVALTQEREADAWRKDLRSVRHALAEKRTILQREFPAFGEALAGKGLFAVLPLTQDQILRLRTENVFLTEDGRVNLGGIPLDRIPEFCDRLRKIL